MAMYLGSNKVEIGQSSGGGGSSDFSTAKVTIVPTTTGKAPFYGEDIDVPDMICGIAEYDGDFYLNKNFYFETLDTQEITILLPPNGSMVVPFRSEPTITGDAIKEFDEPGWLVTITGDCTITGALISDY